MCDFLFILSDIEYLKYSYKPLFIYHDMKYRPHFCGQPPSGYRTGPRASQEVASGQADVAHNNAAGLQLTETHVLEVRRHAGQIPELSRANHQQIGITQSFGGGFS